MYDVIFGEVNDGLKELLNDYCSYWSESGGRVYDENCDVCSILDSLARGNGDHLFNLIFSNLPATASTVIHAATVLLRISGGKPENVHPFSVEYHLFVNCCFTSSTGAKEKKNGILDTSTTYTRAMNEYVKTGDANVIDIGHLMNYMSKSCPGECGKFKTLAVEFTRKLLDEKSEGVLYLGCDDEVEEIASVSSSVREMDTIKRRFSNAIKTANETAQKYSDYQPEEGDGPNYLSNFHECKFCSALPVLTGSINDWEAEYDEISTRLVNTTVTTVVRCMTRKLPSMSESDIVYHKSNPSCVINERRNVYLLEAFSNSKSLSSPANVRNFTNNFLKERNCLVCADTVYAAWLHKLKTTGQGSTEKIARYISRVFRDHGVSF
jgi:hypothetical protein